MSKLIVQFSIKHHGDAAAKHEIPLVDCRIIPNPWRRGDRASDDERRAKVREEPQFEGLVRYGTSLLARHKAIGVACLFGRHRSVAVAEEIAARTGAQIITLAEFELLSRKLEG